MLNVNSRSLRHKSSAACTAITARQLQALVRPRTHTKDPPPEVGGGTGFSARSEERRGGKEGKLGREQDPAKSRSPRHSPRRRTTRSRTVNQTRTRPVYPTHVRE